MSKLKLNEIGPIVFDMPDPPPPPAHVQTVDRPKTSFSSYYHSRFIPDSGFIGYIKSVENNKEYSKSGWDKNKKRWFAHNDAGSPAIGYGHRILKGEDFSKGITDDEAVKLLIKDIIIADKRAEIIVDRKHGSGSYNKLGRSQKEMLVDFAFNGVLHLFPKFVKAVIDNDYSTIKKEYKRFTGGREMTGRNKGFASRYLAN